MNKFSLKVKSLYFTTTFRRPVFLPHTSPSSHQVSTKGWLFWVPSSNFQFRSHWQRELQHTSLERGDDWPSYTAQGDLIMGLKRRWEPVMGLKRTQPPPPSSSSSSSSLSWFMISDCQPRDCTNPAATSVDSRTWGYFAKASLGWELKEIIGDFFKWSEWWLWKIRKSLGHSANTSQHLLI